MTAGETTVEAVNQAVADMRINASTGSLPESEQKSTVERAAEVLAGEAEAEASKSTDSN